MSAADEEHGPAHASLEPPIDAIATVAVDGALVTRVEVNRGETLRVHVRPRGEDADRDEWGDYADADGPDPEADVPDDVHESVSVRSTSWVTVTVDGERRTRFGANDDLVTIHAERVDS
ncbi:hypothetical protein HrrHc1_180 [Halorubrum phage Hardycor1]|nr:hypothetical protein HrrHc1_180 [Halorubrum phage Hardycor1]